MDKKNLMVIKIFLIFMLLSSFSIFSVASETNIGIDYRYKVFTLFTGEYASDITGSIPYTDDELENLGYDNFKILGLYGTHRFNLSEHGNMLSSGGYIMFSNTYNASITISLSTTNTLSISDLDKDGNPRVHNKTVPPIDENVIFRPIRDTSWIKLDETVFTIMPYSQYKAYYTVEISKVDAWNGIDKNTSNGFLGYIIIKDKKDVPTGMNIGIDYRYKTFTLFTGEYTSDVFFVEPIYLVAAIITIVGIIVTYILYTKLEWVDAEDGGGL